MTTSLTLHSFRQNVTDQFSAVTRSRAAWCFATVWIVSALYLLIAGYGDMVLFRLVYLLALLLFCAITVSMTQDQPHETETGARRRLRLQAAVVGVFILFTLYDGLQFHGVVPESESIPIWSPIRQSLERLGGQWFGNDGYVANPAAYFIIPAAALLLLGARPQGLGLGRGHRVWQVTLLWVSLPLIMLLVALLGGQLTIQRLFGRLASNFMQNGFFEEFLFRGALQTRLRKLTTPAWALVLQALIFGLWHLGLGYSETGGSDLLAAAASTIVAQASLGLAFGMIFERTRNLFASSAFHIVINSVG